MSFRDFNDVARPDFLALPINGTTYVIPPVGAADGVRFELATSKPKEGQKPPEPLSDEEFLAMFLGPALVEMRANNVPDIAVTRAALTALADHQQGRAIAETIWETNAVPERLAAYMAAQIGPASRPSKSAAAVRKTRSRASSSGTTTRTATATPQTAKRVGSSRGSKSSSNSA